jgi:general stress protein YciG
MAKKELTIREAGAKGGKARAKNLDKKALSEIGKKGAQTRWAKKPLKGGN